MSTVITKNSFKLMWERFKERVLLRTHINRIYHLFSGHIYFQLLYAAAELDLFTLLEQEPGLSREAIATRLQIEAKPARILLMGLVTIKLLKKRGDRYFNTYLAKQALVSTNPRNIIPVIRLEHHIIYRPMHDFLSAVRENRNLGLDQYSKGDEPTLYARLSHYPELESVFQDAVEAISVQSNKALREHVDFSRFKHIVDVGGGNGANLAALLEQYPQSKGTVFDLPTVCEIARQHLTEIGMSDRIDATPGDCFADAFPTGPDCFLFAHFFTIWSEEKDQLLLKKAFEALPKGGAAIVFNQMQHDNETGPCCAATGSPYFLALATGEGMLYTWKEYETWMREAGFSTVHRIKLLRDHGAIIGIK